MTSQHTPGPWHVGDNFSGPTIVYNQKGWCVADCRAPHGKFHPDGAREANARLIAAAPDLLEALRYLLAQTIEQDEAYSIELTEGEADAAKMARAAIAKVEGR